MIKMIIVFASCAYSLVAIAQQNTIEIDLPGGGKFDCYASMCFDSDSEKRGAVHDSKMVAENECNIRSIYSKERCEKARGEYSARKQCYEELCSYASCRVKNITTGKCVGGYEFRR